MYCWYTSFLSPIHLICRHDISSLKKKFILCRNKEAITCKPSTNIYLCTWYTCIFNSLSKSIPRIKILEKGNIKFIFKFLWALFQDFHK